jgi:TonB family protein
MAPRIAFGPIYCLVVASALACPNLAVAIKTAAPQPIATPDWQADFEQAFAEGQYLEAADSMKLMISSLLADPDFDRLAYGRLLTQLAYAQHHGGMLDAAVQNYELAISVIEEAGNRLDSELVAPLLGLSRSLAVARRYNESIKSYHRTLHVHQVNSGLFGDETAAIIAELSEVHFRAGDYDTANDLQESYVTVVERSYPGYSIERLPSMYSRAEMLVRTGSHYRALKAYRRLIELIENAEGSDSLKLVPALTATAHLLANTSIVDGEDGNAKARRYLRRAVAVAEKNDSASPADQAEAYVALGDFLSVQSANRNSMLRAYERAWNLLDSGDEFRDLRDRLFAEPRHLNPVPGGSPAMLLSLLENAMEPGTTKNGYILVQYDIDTDGRSDNVQLVESTPQGLYDYVVLNHVRSFAFRPKFVDGEPVRSTGQQFEVQFSYELEDLPEEVRQNMAQLPATDASNRP